MKIEENKRHFPNYLGEMTQCPKDHRHEVINLGDGVIVWSSTKAGKHRVRYGLQAKDFHGGTGDVEAAQEFGYCVRHWRECEGKLLPDGQTQPLGH